MTISCDVFWSTSINLHLPDVTLTSYTNGLVKPVLGSDGDFDKMVETLVNEIRTLIEPKNRPDLVYHPGPSPLTRWRAHS